MICVFHGYTHDLAFRTLNNRLYCRKVCCVQHRLLRISQSTMDSMLYAVQFSTIQPLVLSTVWHGCSTCRGFSSSAGAIRRRLFSKALRQSIAASSFSNTLNHGRPAGKKPRRQAQQGHTGQHTRALPPLFSSCTHPSQIYSRRTPSLEGSIRLSSGTVPTQCLAIMDSPSLFSISLFFVFSVDVQGTEAPIALQILITYNTKLPRAQSNWPQSMNVCVTCSFEDVRHPIVQ